MVTTSSASETNPFSGLNGVSNSKTTDKSKGKSSADAMQNQFMTMLVTQLRNQSPLNPMQSAEMTSQLAQINTVSGIEKLNSTLGSMMSAYTASQSIQAAAMLGKNVLIPGGNLGLVKSQAVGGFELDGDADKVRLTIKDADGKVVNTVDFGAAKAGSHLYAWDGKSEAGVVLKDGSYTVTVDAAKAGEAVTGRTLQLGMVSAVVRGKSGYQLDVGIGSLINFDDVRQIL